MFFSTLKYQYFCVTDLSGISFTKQKFIKNLTTNKRQSDLILKV